MIYRKTFSTTAQLAAYYDAKYKSMGGTWVTPPEDCNKHLDDLGVPFDKRKILLDVGCGGGDFIIEAGKRVIAEGVEISPLAIKLGIERCRDSEKICGSSAFVVPRPSDIAVIDWPGDRWDYIVSIGSLEHVIELDKALDNIKRLLKPTGQWYFYNPNEKWTHDDQPNERTATSAEWRAIFSTHGLITDHEKEWGACTAFWGHKE